MLRMKRSTMIRTALVLLLCCFCSVADAQHKYRWHSLILRGNRNYNSHVHGGSFVQRADGKMLVTYKIKNKAMLSIVDSEEELLKKSNASKTGEQRIYSYYTQTDSARTALQKLKNGKILLYIVEPGINDSPSKPFRLTVLESANGLGTDFKPKSTVYTHVRQYFTFGDMSMGTPVETKGRILVPVVVPAAEGGEDDGRLYCAISRDGGAHWLFSQIAPDRWTRAASRGFGIAGNQVIVLVQNGYGAGTTTMYSHSLDDLEGSPMVAQDLPAWTAHDAYQQTDIADMLASHLFMGGDGYTYFLRDATFEGSTSGKYFVYRRPSSRAIDFNGQMPYTLGPRGSGATWEGPLNRDSYGDDATEFFSVTPSGDLAFYGTSNFGGGALSRIYVGVPR